MTAEKNYWLIKSELNAFSWNDLQKMPQKRVQWDGVRNYQARNYMFQMKVNDQIFFYHSSCKIPEIVGIVRVVRQAYPDYTAWDISNDKYDPKATKDNPRWYMVDVAIQRKLNRSISLSEIQNHHEFLENFQLLRKGSRLSIMPVTPEYWDFILSLETK